MKRYVAAEIRQVAAKSTHTERYWKRFYYAKSGHARGRLAAEARARWMHRLAGGLIGSVLRSSAVDQ